MKIFHQMNICLQGYENYHMQDEIAAIDGHILRVLQVNSVCIGAVTGGQNTNTGNLNICTIVEFEMCLRAVLNCYPGHCHTTTSIEPQSLSTQNLYSQSPNF